MIRVTGLCKTFGGGDAPAGRAGETGRQVLAGVDLTIDGPTVLMGPSGQGKTTLLRILMGLETPDTGSIEGLAGRRIAPMFQEDRLCPQLTAADNICLTGRGVTRAEAEAELRALGFADADLKTPAAKLSGGQKRRAALLRALLCRGADLLLLAAPFTGMDGALVGQAAAAAVRLAARRGTQLGPPPPPAAAPPGWPGTALAE